MLHAVLLFAGLAGLFVALVGVSAASVAAATAAAVIAVVWTARLGGVDGESAPYWRLARLTPLLLRRTPAAWAGAAGAARAAVAADVTLNPALVRVRTRAMTDGARAAFAHLINAAPGGIVVDLDADSMLVHVMDETALEAEPLRDLEGDVVSALEPRGQAA